MYTYWDYMRKRWERDGGLRIDLLLLSGQSAKRLKDAGVDREVRARKVLATTRLPGSYCAMLRNRGGIPIRSSAGGKPRVANRERSGPAGLTSGRC